MPTATARFSVNELIQTGDPDGLLSIIVSEGLLNGTDPEIPVDVRYRQPTIPIAQYYTEELGEGAVDSSLPTLYDSGFEADTIIAALHEGTLDTREYEWGDLTITVEATGNGRAKVTMSI